MDFPITDLMDEHACYAQLVAWLHPDGLACPRCHQHDRLGVHSPPPRPDPGLPLRPLRPRLQRLDRHGPARPQAPPSELVLIIRGFAQGVPTAQLARELGCDRSELLELAAPAPRPGLQEPGRCRWMTRCWRRTRPTRMRGKKACRIATRRTRRGGGPTRPRARHLGERPAAGLRGRRAREREGPADGGRAIRRRDVGRGWCGARPGRWWRSTPTSGAGTTAARDGAVARDGLPRGREWARDDDGDGIREVHDNTLEGLWTGHEELLEALPRCEQEIPIPVCGDVRVGLQRQAGDGGVPVGIPWA